METKKANITVMGCGPRRIFSLILPAIITLIALSVFSEVLVADFVMWDDDIFIYKNPKLGGLSFESIYWAFTDADLMMRYNPLTLISWSATYHFFGLNPFGYHLVNWILHGLSSGVLFLIIRKILLAARGKFQPPVHRPGWYIDLTAAIATLCWAIHPLRVEPVAWATDRTYCQAVFFLLLSTLFYIKAIESEFEKKKYLIWIGTAVIFYTLSLLSYAIGITYFAVLFILDVYLFKRIGENIGWYKPHAAKKVLLEKIIFANPAVLIAITSVVVRNYSNSPWGPPVSFSEFGVFDRLMQAVYILVYYIYRPFYPIDLSPVYSSLVAFDPLSSPFLVRAILLIIALIVTFMLRKRYPLLFAILLSHIILLIPVMGFFEHPHYHCDRFPIVSSICLSILIGFGLVVIKNKRRAAVAFLGTIVAICILSWMSINQVKNWKNSESLFTHMIETLGDDPYRQDIYCRLGKYFYENGQEKRAIINFKNALVINPDNFLANYYLSDIEFKNNNLLGSIGYLETLLKNNPDEIAFHKQLSFLYKRLGDSKESISHFKYAEKLSR